MRFLIAEDNDGQAKLLTRLLQPFATAFCYTKTLQDTLRISKEQDFEVIILDLVLLDVGWQVTLGSIEVIRRYNKKTKIIVCSGIHEPQIDKFAMDAGADVFVHKDQGLYSDGAKALYIAVNVAMRYATEADSYWPYVYALREFVSELNQENKNQTSS
jgi:DNA-binding response OmpR family regulator